MSDTSAPPLPPSDAAAPAAAPAAYKTAVMGTDIVLFKQGAEARLYYTTFNGKRCLAKERFQKTYRHPELDAKLRKRQLASEHKALEKAHKAGLPVPKVIHVDKTNCVLYLEELPTVTVRDYIHSLGCLTDAAALPAVENIALKIGEAIANVHTCRIMHGDLTTSNMLIPAPPAGSPVAAAIAAAAEASTLPPYGVRPLDPAAVEVARGYLPDKVYLVDFGLSFVSDMVEDRSVDFYVMERAIQTTHPHSEYLIHKVYNLYKNKNVLGNKVMTRLNDVRARGRKKSMIG